ncbi:VirK/YbjX family protein, partial [Salmonella enterica subsp. enterica serovar Cerro]|nr:VirK/YbjX family protein [Salmonella enterica subsp. enterica serovar Cerro]
TPLARLSFSFIRHEGKQIALVAGLQGPSKHIGPQVIRNATKDWYQQVKEDIDAEQSATETLSERLQDLSL